MDSFNEEALMNLEDVRLQLQTQLTPENFENLFFDANGSADGCNQFEMQHNLNNISKENIELIKDKLRSFTNRVKHRTLKQVPQPKDQDRKMDAFQE